MCLGDHDVSGIVRLAEVCDHVREPLAAGVVVALQRVGADLAAAATLFHYQVAEPVARRGGDHAHSDTTGISVVTLDGDHHQHLARPRLPGFTPPTRASSAARDRGGPIAL
jgi:hypothetical protein